MTVKKQKKDFTEKKMKTLISPMGFEPWTSTTGGANIKY